MKIFTLGALALLMVGSVLVAPAGRALDPTGDCHFNATTKNTIVPAPGAFFGTNWTPDCATIASGDSITFTNGDGEAVHGVWITGKHVDEETGKVVENNNCWKGAALQVPRADQDTIKITYNKATGNLDLVVASTRAANTNNLAGASAVAISCPLSEAGATLSEDGTQVVLAYECIVHRAAMTGHIHVDIPADQDG